MKPLLLFGPLQYPPLLEAVLGDIGHLTLTPIALDRLLIRDAYDAPTAVPMGTPEDPLRGASVTGLTATDMDALDFYNGTLGRIRADATCSDGAAAHTYVREDTLDLSPAGWSLADWVRDWADLCILAAREVMQYRGERSVADVGAMLPVIRARAWSRLNAKHSLHGAGTLGGQVDVHNQKRPYAQFFALDEYDLQFARFDGSRSETVKRAVFLAPDAALVLPYDPPRDRVLLVEQMRMGPLARGDRALWQLEPIAGRLDPGEDPQTAARREAREEAGLTLGVLEPVAEAYCSPGNSSEFYYIYVGLADLPDEVVGIGGLSAEDEDIRSHVIGFDALMDMCDAQHVANAPLVMAAYWLARHRDRLRSGAKERFST